MPVHCFNFAAVSRRAKEVTSLTAIPLFCSPPTSLSYSNSEAIAVRSTEGFCGATVGNVFINLITHNSIAAKSAQFLLTSSHSHLRINTTTGSVATIGGVSVAEVSRRGGERSACEADVRLMDDLMLPTKELISTIGGD